MFSMITYSTIQISCVFTVLTHLCSGSDFHNLFQAANCAVNLERKGHNTSLEYNYNHCNESSFSFTNNSVDLIKVEKEYEMTLICRDPDGMTIRIRAEHDDQYRVFVLLINDVNGNEILGSTRVNITNNPVIVVKNLDPDTEYNITSYAFYGNGQYSIISNNFTVKTLSEGFKPLNVTDVSFRYERNNETSYMLDVFVDWSIAQDQNCNYDVYYFIEGDYVTKEYRRDNFEHHLVHYNDTQRKICVNIIAQNLLHAELESKWEQCDEAPTCLQWYDNNIDICAPPKPENITSTITTVTRTNLNYSVVLDVEISWDSLVIPDYFVIEIFDDTQLTSVVNVIGNLTSVLMRNIGLMGVKYNIAVTAVSKGGAATEYTERKVDLPNYPSGSVNMVFFVMGPVVALIVTMCTAILLFHRRAKLQRFREQCKYFEDLERKAPVDEHIDFKPKDLTIMLSLSQMYNDLPSSLQIDDEMEVAPDRLQILDILGEGEFGLVKRCVVKQLDGTEQEVAVKMLKDFPSIEEIKEFRQEIEVMKSVGKHENIVSIIGHCTRNVSQLMLLTEYCPSGSLLYVLRSEWESLTQNSIIKRFSPIHINQKRPENVFNFDVSFIKKASLKYKKIADSLHKCDIESPLDLGTASEKTWNEPNNNNSSSDQMIHENNVTNIIINKLYDELSNECIHETSSDCNEHLARDPDLPIPIDCVCQLRLSNKTKTHVVENLGYDILRQICCDNVDDEENSSERMRLTSNDLISFARQIAAGMEFLSMNKVIHRDLAARNVLVGTDKTVKIADFGLSRDIYRENMYKKKGNGKLPIKWLALESMTHQLYTSQSDVWSYGILLYEIVTLGGTPYPSTATDRLLQLLRTGYRMGKPSNCSDELYHLMSSCWYTNPGDRPTFSAIRSTLATINVEPNKNQFIEMLVLDKAMRAKLNVSDDSYLKPL